MEQRKDYSLPVLIPEVEPALEDYESFVEKPCNERPGEKCNNYSIKKVLYQGSTPFQDVLIFESVAFGRVLCLDDVLQLTEFDEFAYHEMLAFTPLSCHPNPQKVLIIGGGDGGLAREVLKFPTVESVTLCEIDKDIIDLCEKYFPSMTKYIRHPKVNLVIQDAFDLLASKESKEKYDVILVDSTDPDCDGPQRSLMHEKFYSLVEKSLLPNGIVCSQLGTNIWQRQKVSENLISIHKKLFQSTKCFFIEVPSFAMNQNGCLLSAKTKGIDFTHPKWKFSSEELDRMGMEYYSSNIHTASFGLPRFSEKYFENIGTENGHKTP